VAPSKAGDAELVERAIKSGNFVTMRSLISKYLSDLFDVG